MPLQCRSAVTVHQDLLNRAAAVLFPTSAARAGSLKDGTDNVREARRGRCQNLTKRNRTKNHGCVGFKAFLLALPSPPPPVQPQSLHALALAACEKWGPATTPSPSGRAQGSRAEVGQHWPPLAHLTLHPSTASSPTPPQVPMWQQQPSSCHHDHSRLGLLLPPAQHRLPRHPGISSSSRPLTA